MDRSMSQASKDVLSVYDEYDNLMDSVLKEDEVKTSQRSCMDYLKTNIESIKERLYENELLLRATKKSLAAFPTGKNTKSEEIEGSKPFQSRISDLVETMTKSYKDKTTDKSLQKNFKKFQELLNDTVNDLQKMAQLKSTESQPVNDASEYGKILNSMRSERRGLELKDQHVARIIKRLESHQIKRQIQVVESTVQPRT